MIKDTQQDEKSRSQVKREFRELKDLGKQLASLSKGQLRALPLSEDTRHALLAAKEMTRGALQRQYRHLSSLLAEEDVAAQIALLIEELTPLFDAAANGLKDALSHTSALPELSEPTGNGVAYEKFLNIYNELYGLGADEQPDPSFKIEA